MALNWFGTKKKEPGWLALSMGEGRLSYVHGRFVPSGKSQITRFGSAAMESEGDADRLARDLHVDRFECATLLEPGDYQLLMVEAPTVPPAELKSAIRWKIKDMLDYHVDDAALDVLDIPPESDAGGRNHSMYAVAAPNDAVKACVKRFEDARVTLSVIDIQETAQRNLSALHEPEGRGAALLHIGAEAGLLTVTYRGELYLTRRIDIGLKQVLGRVESQRDELFGRIVLELQRTFDHFERQFHYVSVAKLLLAPEPEETGMQPYLQSNLDLPVERVDLAAHLQFGAGVEPDAATQWQLFHLIGASLRHDAKVL